jgi:hypothetical protein
MKAGSRYGEPFLFKEYFALSGAAGADEARMYQDTRASSAFLWFRRNISTSSRSAQRELLANARQTAFNAASPVMR